MNKEITYRYDPQIKSLNIRRIFLFSNDIELKATPNTSKIYNYWKYTQFESWYKFNKMILRG